MEKTTRRNRKKGTGDNSVGTRAANVIATFAMRIDFIFLVAVCKSANKNQSIDARRALMFHIGCQRVRSGPAGGGGSRIEKGVKGSRPRAQLIFEPG